MWHIIIILTSSALVYLQKKKYGYGLTSKIILLFDLNDIVYWMYLFTL